jgi:outer membrane receptor for ferrienterochelin and colicins
MQHLKARVTFALLGAIASTVSAQGRSSDPRSARVTGRVADAVGTAIVKAEVRVTNMSFRAETGDDGRFDLTGLPSGPVEVVVRRLGFAPAKIALELGEGELRDIRVLLAPVAMTLDSVAVTAEPAPTVEKAYGGFEMRKSRGFGTFITREQIEKKNPRVTTDLFRTVSGVKLLRESGTPTVVSTRLGTTAYCPVRYFIDGASYQLYGQSIDTMIQVADIGAIEVYPGGATVPPQFGGRESACGVIAIWTRQGQRKQ